MAFQADTARLLPEDGAIEPPLDTALALRPAPLVLTAPRAPASPRGHSGPGLAISAAPAAIEAEPVRALAKPIKRMPLSERVASHPAYVGLWEAVRTNDAEACAKHLQALDNLDNGVLHHTLSHEVLDLGAFAPKDAPEGSAWIEGHPLPPAEACDAYALIVARAKPYAEEEVSAKMGPGRPASIAAALGHTKVLEVMLKYDVSICNLSEIVVLDRGKVLHTTPAFWAAYFGHADCLKLLQGYGISVSAVREAITYKAQPATVKWLGCARNDRQAKSAFEAAMRSAIERSSDASTREGALQDLQVLITDGKVALDVPCGEAPSGWLAAALIQRTVPLQDAPEPAYAAAELMLRAGAPLRPLGLSKDDCLQVSLRSGKHSLIATFLQRNAKRQLLGGSAPLDVTQTHLMAAIDGEVPQPTLAQLFAAGYAPKNSAAALALYEAAYDTKQSRIIEILQTEYRLLEDQEGRAFAQLSTHRPMSPQGRASYQARGDRLLSQCHGDEPAVPFDQKFSGNARADLNANLDQAPEHAWWGLRPVYKAIRAFGVMTKDYVPAATLRLIACCCEEKPSKTATSATRRQ